MVKKKKPMVQLEYEKENQQLPVMLENSRHMEMEFRLLVSSIHSFGSNSSTC